MCTHFKSETDVTQNLIDDIFLTLSGDPSIVRVLIDKKNMGIRLYFLKKTPET